MSKLIKAITNGKFTKVRELLKAGRIQMKKITIRLL